VHPGDAFLTSGEVAEVLHVSSKTILRWADEGRIPFTMTPGGQRRFRRHDVDSTSDQMIFPRAPITLPDGGTETAHFTPHTE
jgi:excisionase family DNA binding protein